MKFDKFFHGIAPIVALAMTGMASACDKASIEINGEEGVPLADLDLTGKTADELVLLGPDEVRITAGEALAITVEGDPAAVEAMRFTLKDRALGVLRQGKFSNKSEGRAVVLVTMPAPAKLVLLGSGTIHADRLAAKSSVVVTGSGLVDTPAVGADALDLVIGGSGTHRAAGNVAQLDLKLAGSGSGEYAALKADKANLVIAGSGKVTFASDGEVSANILGSGEVTVRGRARCKVSAMGSGKLICETAPEAAQAPAAPSAPTPPQSPTPPAAPAPDA